MQGNEFTADQRKGYLDKFDGLADGIISTATGLGGLNGLGLFAGQVKAVSLLVAIIYTLPVLAFGIAIIFALFVRYQQWDLLPETYGVFVVKKKTFYTRSFTFLIAGIVLLFLAALVYTARAIQSIT
ncbi:MAG: hypothetical protein H0U76_27575 [Ktedonobacteraceae bacterium]|nr:hypothetical protein [Ktedonobacteraceae bacterium]